MQPSSDDRNLPERLLEKRAKSILDRAMELDHVNGPQMSMQNLRTIARELGISDDALDTALREELKRGAQLEMAASPASAEEAGFQEGWLSRWWGGNRRRWSKGLQSLTKLALPVGLFVGAMSGLLSFDSVDRDTLLLFFAAVGTAWSGLIAVRPYRSTAAQTIGISFLYWLGLTIGLATAIMSRNDPGEVISICTMFFLASSLLGIAITGLASLVNYFRPGGAAPGGGSRVPLQNWQSREDDSYHSPDTLKLAAAE